MTGLRWAVRAGAAAFVLLCLLHYGSMRPLWLDEQVVLGSLVKKSPAELFGPLLHAQAFPRVQLWLVQQIGQAADYHVAALRSVSFFAMLAAFGVWMRFYGRSLGRASVELLLAVLLFACSYRLTYYAAELKPYAMDVLVVALWTGFVCRVSTWVRARPGRAYAVSALMPGTILLSYAGIVAAGLSLWHMAWLARLHRPARPIAAVHGLAVLGIIVTFYAIDVRFSSGGQALNSYWQDSFICTDGIRCFLDTFGDGFKKLVTYWYGVSKGYRRAAVTLIPLFCIGVFRGAHELVYRRGVVTSVSAAGVVILAELVILGLLHKYPFTGERITLFFAPFAILLTVQGLQTLRRWPWLFRVSAGFVAVYALVCLIRTTQQHLGLYN